ncbi:hypothetical protein [Streptomyces sp. NPDC057002]
MDRGTALHDIITDTVASLEAWVLCFSALFTLHAGISVLPPDFGY